MDLQAPGRVVCSANASNWVGMVGENRIGSVQARVEGEESGRSTGEGLSPVEGCCNIIKVE